MAGFFGMFDFTKPGKGVSKEDLDKQGLGLYFDILGRRLGKILLLNILYFIVSIPALIIYSLLSNVILSLFISFDKIDATSLLLMNLFLSTSLLLLLGSGSATAAMNYVLRKYVNDTHAWVWSDFWDAFKENFWQGTASFFLNIIILSLCVVAIDFYKSLGGGIGIALTTVVSIVTAIFLMMQIYFYQIMASVTLKIKDIYRNAFLLTVGRLPVSIAAAIVSAVVIYAMFMTFNVFSIIVAMVLYYTLPVYTQIFITNNTINKYLIEPGEKAE